MGPVRVFDEYAAGYHHLDVDKATDLFAEDAVFKEPRFPLIKGKDAIREFLQSEYEKMEKGTYKIMKLSTCVEGNRMAVERRINVRVKAVKEAVGVEGVSLVEFRNGLIQRMTEYFDSKSYSY